MCHHIQLGKPFLQDILSLVIMSKYTITRPVLIPLNVSRSSLLSEMATWLCWWRWQLEPPDARSQHLQEQFSLSYPNPGYRGRKGSAQLNLGRRECHSRVNWTPAQAMGSPSTEIKTKPPLRSAFEQSLPPACYTCLMSSNLLLSVHCLWELGWNLTPAQILSNSAAWYKEKFFTGQLS